MNKRSRERLSRDYVTRTAWLYEYRFYNSRKPPEAWKPKIRLSYVRLSLNDLMRIERDEAGEAAVLSMTSVFETQVVIGRSKAEFLKSPILDQGPRVKLNTEN